MRVIICQVVVSSAATISTGGIFRFIGLSLLFALLQTFESMLRARVALATRLAVKHLVMERILYSEIGSLQQRYNADINNTATANDSAFGIDIPAGSPITAANAVGGGAAGTGGVEIR